MEYICRNKDLVYLGENTMFNQKCIFDGDGIVKIGDNVTLGYELSPHFYGFYILIQARGKNSIISIGNNTIFSNDITIIAQRQIKIGERCLIGDRLTMYDNDSHEIDPSTRTRSYGKAAPINIGNNVWIGSVVTILKGVNIGDNSVIAANSVVTNDVPANTIVAGNPATIVRAI
ncbi:DapH/DapD/GlmU-related protein [uncultured Clostridium sp.]|uniref:DapH/DapD/GlmU-related protein n=1 Tax=uncultured Clostridium sp. TaxID=59620 RepID=UPI0028EBDAD7|nr:DapH/DapD/GlmU-related protein [uncultured Clostridium sp.]